MTKKFTLVLLIVGLAVAGVVAETPEFFSFNIGAMGSYQVDGGGTPIGVANPFGLQFQVDEMFSMGFEFSPVTSLLNITVNPMNNVNISLSTGQVDANLGFGVGLGYDFLTKKDALFSSMGIYIDWLANNTATTNDYSLADGGAIRVGLKTKFGL